MKPDLSEYYVVEKAGMYEINSKLYLIDNTWGPSYLMKEMSREEIVPKVQEQYPDLEFI